MDPAALTPEIIRKELASQTFGLPYNHFPEELMEGPPRPAAVLIPFIWQDGEWQILFIRRTEAHTDRHSGQVAFPGGRQDDSDRSPLDAALREAQEELGIHPQDVRILGHLNEFITITTYQVTPFVGVLPWPYPITPAPDEVARVFSIPLAWLADPENRVELTRQLPNDLGEVSVDYFKEYDQEILWGASARMVIELLELLGLNGQA